MIWKFLKFVLGLFYDKRFLQGRFFERTRGGYLWALRGVLWQRVFGFNRAARFPVSPMNSLVNPAGLVFHPDDLNNFQGVGKYFYSVGATITIGHGTYIANNVGIVTQNHVLDDLDRTTAGEAVTLGERCWIGMNCVIMPGVELGEGTIVGAGSVVTRSFPGGRVVIAGSPAQVVKTLP